MTDHCTELPVVDVVVLTWNDAADATIAIGSALESREIDVRVIVVDNASAVPFEWTGPSAAVRVHRSERNLGVGGGRNLGAQLGSAEFICFLDSDAVLGGQALRGLVDELVGDPELGLVGPVFLGHRPEESGGRAPTVVRKLCRGLRLTDRYAPGRANSACGARAVDFVIGACQVLPRRVYEAVGPIDETYQFGPEDLEFCQRVRRAGWGVAQVEGPEVRHDARRVFRNPFGAKGRAHLAAVARYYRHQR